MLLKIKLSKYQIRNIIWLFQVVVKKSPAIIVWIPWGKILIMSVIHFSTVTFGQRAGTYSVQIINLGLSVAIQIQSIGRLGRFISANCREFLT